MPRYFFDAHDGVALPDDLGHECADHDEAKKIAATYAGELLQHTPERFWQEGDWTVVVRDEHGLQLFSIVIIGMPAPATTDPIRSEVFDLAWKG